MTAYQMARVSLDDYLYIWCTDELLIESVVAEVATLAPKYELWGKDWGGNKDPHGRHLAYEFHKLGDRDEEIRNWLIQFLLERGWEPFHISEIAGSDGHTKRRELFLRRPFDLPHATSNPG